MKLRYNNIEIGNLSNLHCDMNRECGALEPLSNSQRQASEISTQLFEWVEINSRLDELEFDDGDKENPEFDKLWGRLNSLPNFETHNCWNLFDEKTGKTEKIYSPHFYPESAGWYLAIPETSEEKKDYSGAIGFLIGLIIVAIYSFIEYGYRI